MMAFQAQCAHEGRKEPSQCSMLCPLVLDTDRIDSHVYTLMAVVTTIVGSDSKPWGTTNDAKEVGEK